MIAAITTLMFLGVLWLLGVLALRVAAESGRRIAAAIDGTLMRPGRRASA